jgi:predicted Holliday junction resolvase-like endonuclease
MSSRRRRGSDDSMNLSFLDAISCGFGAVVLLLVLTLVFEPVAIKVTRDAVEAQVAALQERLAAIEGEITALPVVEVPKPTATELAKLAELQSDLTKIRGQFKASNEPEPESAEAGELRAARQQLTEEMQRLLANYRPPPKDTTVGGIPVDSEYIVFVIDNSGSMQAIWPTVERTLLETLQVYPRIKGIQVLNNDGRYLLGNYSRRWIPDSRGNRRLIASALANWQVFSSSNPTQGILEAITRFYDPGKKISVYVFGDDFMRGNVYVESVLRSIDRINAADASGQRRVRIHGVGFPGTGSDPVRYARFMRAMCERNGGTFVALTEVEAGPRIRIQGPFGRVDGQVPGRRVAVAPQHDAGLPVAAGS